MAYSSLSKKKIGKKKDLSFYNAIEETKEKESVNPKGKDKTPETNDKGTKKKEKYAQG